MAFSNCAETFAVSLTAVIDARQRGGQFHRRGARAYPARHLLEIRRRRPGGRCPSAIQGLRQPLTAACAASGRGQHRQQRRRLLPLNNAHRCKLPLILLAASGLHPQQVRPCGQGFLDLGGCKGTDSGSPGQPEQFWAAAEADDQHCTVFSKSGTKSRLAFTEFWTPFGGIYCRLDT